MPNLSTETRVKLQICDGIAAISLNAPAQRNALNHAAWLQLAELCASLQRDDNVRLVTLRGTGAHFCAGADITELRANIQNTSWMTQNQAAVGLALDAYAGLTQPTIAIIQGACVGGGAALAFSSDFRIAADDLRLSITPARLGLSYRLVDCLRVERVVGHARARELLLLAREIDAATAQNWGAVTEVCKPENLDAIAADFITRMLSLSASSQRAIKANLRKIANGITADDAQSMADFAAAFTAPDFANAAAKFVEKSNKTP